MCNLKEQVVVVDNDRLAAPWVTCRGEGRRVVFVRKDSEHLIGEFCARGIASCPIWAALAKAA